MDKAKSCDYIRDCRRCQLKDYPDCLELVAWARSRTAGARELLEAADKMIGFDDLQRGSNAPRGEKIN